MALRALFFIKPVSRAGHTVGRAPFGDEVLRGHGRARVRRLDQRSCSGAQCLVLGRTTRLMHRWSSPPPPPSQHRRIRTPLEAIECTCVHGLVGAARIWMQRLAAKHVQGET